jgi:hypothetical protein
MYEPAPKHGLDPSATGFLKSTLPGSRYYCFERGVVECSFYIQKGTQRNLFVFQTLFQSLDYLEESCFCRPYKFTPLLNLQPLYFTFNTILACCIPSYQPFISDGSIIFDLRLPFSGTQLEHKTRPLFIPFRTGILDMPLYYNENALYPYVNGTTQKYKADQCIIAHVLPTQLPKNMNVQGKYSMHSFYHAI